MSKYLRISDVALKVGIAKSTIWLWVTQNRFPKPIKLSSRITVWEEQKIEMWLKSKQTED